MGRVLFLCGFCFISLFLHAQDTLPKFSVNLAGSNNRVVVGWVNTYGLVKQIGIQRSFDSLVNYKTILTVADPNARQNGFADTKAQNDHMFYRLFVVLDHDQYFFTAVKKPVRDTSTVALNPKEPDAPVITKPPVPKKPEFVPSFYVYTNKDGYVFINLPDAGKKKYHIKFFEDSEPIFEIKSIKEPALTLDKTNFMHAGWFNFELYDDEKLIEKNKFYLAKEF